MSRRLFIAVFVVVAALYFVAEYVVARRAVPTDDAKTFAGWLAWQPEARRFMIAADKQHLLAIGRDGGLLPSGPAVYVFDTESRLIDWTRDLGDDPVFERKWSIRSLVFVDRAQAEEWLRETATR